MDPDLELLERWRAGDRQAGNDLFQRHFADIYRFLEHKVGVDADDLTQRTFTACIAARDQFRGQSTFRTYLFAIARHEFHAFLRAKLKRGDLDFGVTSLAELATSATSLIGRQQQAGRLRQALSELPADQQMLLELHYWHDHDASALAAIFEAEPGTIRVRLTRARQALRGKLAALGLGPLPPAPGDRLQAALDEPDPGSS
jgi:RNA polymerase sigma factor (sigma-70 family)